MPFPFRFVMNQGGFYRRFAAVLVLLSIGLGGAAQTTIRIAATNISSGDYQAYEDPGQRILRAIKPDVTLIQEFEVPGDNTANGVNAFVATNFGAGFEWFREPVPGANIPNGIISRWPILAAGEWNDPEATDRDFVWARIDIPGDIDLYAISVHLLTANSSTRNAQAQAIMNTFIPTLNAPANAYFVLGGDFNTDNRGESCITTFSSRFVTGSPYPVGQDGDPDTNAGRSSPYDWVVANSNLNALKTATTYGSFSYTNGLVFDTRDFTQTQLNSAFSPALTSDSGVSGMQHMAVVRTFVIPGTGTVSNGDGVVVVATDRAPASAAPGSTIPMLGITLTASSNEWDAASVRLHRLGTVGDAQVSAIVYQDANTNGAIDAGDPQLGSAAFSGGSALVSLSPAPRSTPGAPVTLLAAAQVAGSVSDGATLQFQLEANGVLHSSSGGNDLDPTFAAVTSGLCTFIAVPVFVGPPVVINKFLNASSGDVVELLVAQDGADLRGMIIKDFSSSMNSDNGGKYTFSNSTLWSSLRAGTLVILRKSSATADTSTGGSDYLLDIGLDNTTYFANSGGTFDIGSTDMVMIKQAGSGVSGVANSIHLLGAGTAGTQYSSAAAPKLCATTGAASGQYAIVDNAHPSSGASSVLSNFTEGTGTATGGLTSGVTFGAGNNAANTAFINFLRGTPAAAATNVTSTGFMANWTALPTAASYRLDVATDAAFTAYVPGMRDISAGSGTSTSVSGLSGGTYWFRVRAINVEGTPSGNNTAVPVTLTSGIDYWQMY